MTMIIIDELNLGAIDEYIRSIIPGDSIEVVTTFKSSLPSQHSADYVGNSLVTFIYCINDAIVAEITEQHDWLLFQLKLKFNVDKLEIVRNCTWDDNLNLLN